MKIDLSDLTDYYATANLSLSDTFEDCVVPGNAMSNGSTAQNACGLVIPLAGSACFTLNSTPYVMEPGMLIHAGPGMRLDKEVIGNKKWHYALIHYRIPDPEHQSSPFYHTHFHLPIGINSRIIDMTRQLLASDAAPGSMAALRSRSLFHQLLEEILLSAKRQHRENHGSLMEDAAAFLQENYSQPLSITQLAEQYRLNGRQFAELFRKHMGVNPSRYLAELRIQHAQELLRTCSCPIKQVAECVGYTDNLYFSKVFRKKTGISPSEFRIHAQNRI